MFTIGGLAVYYFKRMLYVVQILRYADMCEFGIQTIRDITIRDITIRDIQFVTLLFVTIQHRIDEFNVRM